MSHDRVEADSFTLTQKFLSQMLGVRRASVTEVAEQAATGGTYPLQSGSDYYPRSSRSGTSYLRLLWTDQIRVRPLAWLTLGQL